MEHLLKIITPFIRVCLTRLFPFGDSNNRTSNLTEEERQWIIEHPKEVSEMIIKRVDLMNKVSPILKQIKGKVDNKVYSTILWKIVDIEEERQGLENRVKELSSSVSRK